MNDKKTLLENLPDYITGNLKDEILSRKIEQLLLTDQQFRKEFDELNSVSDFVGNTGLTEPPEFYFNNLLPKIRTRLETTVEVRESKNFFKNIFSGKLKFALPALATIVTVSVLYFTGVITDQDENIITSKIENVITKETQSEDHLLNDNTSIPDSAFESDNIAGDNLAGAEFVLGSRTDRISKTPESNLINFEANERIIDEYISELDIYAGDDEYFSYENELDRFSAQELDDILENLTKANL